MRSGIEFGFDVVSGATGSGTQRAATLNHESIDDSMKHDSVVIPDAGQSDQIGAVSGCHLRQQVQQNSSMVRTEFDLVAVLVVVEVLNSGINFRFAILAHVILSEFAEFEQV